MSKTWFEKTVGQTHQLSGKGQVLDTAMSKEGLSDCLLEHKKAHHF